MKVDSLVFGCFNSFCEKLETLLNSIKTKQFLIIGNFNVNFWTSSVQQLSGSMTYYSYFFQFEMGN